MTIECCTTNVKMQMKKFKYFCWIPINGGDQMHVQVGTVIAVL